MPRSRIHVLDRPFRIDPHLGRRPKPQPITWSPHKEVRRESAFDDLVEKYGDAVLPLRADVADRAEAFEAVQRAIDAFGTLDVVIDNAGYGLFGMTEEVTERQASDQIDINVFGALWVTQAALPHLRNRGSDHIIQVSSIGGVTSLPGLGLYPASKFALEGFTASLAPR